MSEKGKSALESKAILGNILCLAPFVSEVLEKALGSGFVPLPVAPYLVLFGSVLSIVGRVVACEPITSVLPKK